MLGWGIRRVFSQVWENPGLPRSCLNPALEALWPSPEEERGPLGALGEGDRNLVYGFGSQPAVATVSQGNPGARPEFLLALGEGKESLTGSRDLVCVWKQR